LTFGVKTKKRKHVRKITVIIDYQIKKIPLKISLQMNQIQLSIFNNYCLEI